MIENVCFLCFEGIASVRCRITRMTSWCSVRSAKIGNFFMFLGFLGMLEFVGWRFYNVLEFLLLEQFMHVVID